MNAFIFAPLILLIPCLMFIRWGWAERDHECYNLAAIYGVGAVVGPIVMFFITHS